MKQLFFLLLTVCLCSGCSQKDNKTSVKQERGLIWQEVQKIDLPLEMNVYVSAPISTEGIIVSGYGGETCYTYNYKTFNKSVNSSLCRFGIDVVNSSVALTIGNGPDPRITVDGGKTWKTLPENGLPEDTGLCSFITSSDGKNIWIGNAGSVCSLTGSTTTWKKLKLPTSSDIIGLYKETRDKGYLLDMKGNLFVTQNDGKSWKKFYTFNEFNFVTFNKNKGYTIANIRFHAKNGSITIMPLVSKKWICLTTFDGGKSWKNHNTILKDGNLFISRDMNRAVVFQPSHNQLILYSHI